jgi:acyl carrier protein
MPDLNELKKNIKHLIVECLHLEDVKPQDIGDEQLLFSKDGGLGLDSLNALEILTNIEFKFGIRFGNDESIKQHFKSVETLALYVASAKPMTTS